MPEPSKYKLPSDFEKKNSGTGYSLGKGRDEIKYANYLNQLA